MAKMSGFIWGTVYSNEDPLGAGRVLVNVPGVWEPHHEDWIPVVGWPGSGHPSRGSAYTMPIDAQVLLLFEQGDTEATPVAIPGPMGASTGVPDGPPLVKELVEDEGVETALAVEVIWEDDILRCYVMHEDDEEGNPLDRRFVVIDKRSGTHIALNATDGAQHKSGTITLHATTSIDIKSNGTISIEGAQVAIQGRPVANKPGTSTI